MSHIRGLLLSVLAAGAVSLGGTATAAALPEFTGYCKTTNHVENCGLFPIPFKLRGKPASFITDLGNANVNCKSVKGTGEITAPTIDTVQLTFSGCILGTPGKKPKCTQVGHPMLEGVIGYVDEATGEVGNALENRTVGPGPKPLAEFECGAGPLRVEGSVVGIITPIDIATNEYNQVLESKGQPDPWEQEIPDLEGEPMDTPFCAFGPPGECALESRDEITTHFATELNAVNG
jgi:hypothetical protein